MYNWLCLINTQYPVCFLQQEALLSLLSTGWFQERIWEWFHNRAEINGGPSRKEILNCRKSSFVRYRRNRSTISCAKKVTVCCCFHVLTRLFFRRLSYIWIILQFIFISMRLTVYLYWEVVNDVLVQMAILYFTKPHPSYYEPVVRTFWHTLLEYKVVWIT